MRPQDRALAAQPDGKYMQLPYVIKGNDVSFSGLLTASIKLAQRAETTDACYSLQETAFAMLTEAVERALSFTSKKEMMIVGGVAANKRLAEMLEAACSRHGTKLFVCPLKFAGDNGTQMHGPPTRIPRYTNQSKLKNRSSSNPGGSTP